MPDDLAGPGATQGEIRPDSQLAFAARWWVWGGLIGLVVGWVIGLVVVRPGPDDLLAAARNLVPDSAQVTHAAAAGKDFQIVAFDIPPLGVVEVVSDLTPEQLSDDFEEAASAQGWTVLPEIRHPGGIEVPLKSLLLRGEATSLVRENSGPLPGPDAKIFVRRRDWTGRTVTAISSLLGAGLGASIGWYTYRRLRGDVTVQHVPLRWRNWASLTVLAAIWLLGLSVIR